MKLKKIYWDCTKPQGEPDFELQKHKKADVDEISNSDGKFCANVTTYNYVHVLSQLVIYFLEDNIGRYFTILRIITRQDHFDDVSHSTSIN